MYFDDEDYNGYHLDLTFSDPLFDLWKLEGHEIFDEMTEVTYNRFLQEFDYKRLATDATWQIMSMKIAASCGSYAVPVYIALQITKSILQHEEQQNMMKGLRFTSDEYRGEKLLSTKDWTDEWFGGNAYMSLIGNPQSIYAPVHVQTDKYTYQGDIVLAPGNPNILDGKTDIGSAWLTLGKSFLSAVTGQDFGTSELEYNDVDLDYNLQARNFMRYSDLYDEEGDYDDKIEQFLKHSDRYNDFHQRLVYADNSYAYLEDAISMETAKREDEGHNEIIPIMFNAYPLLSFIPEDNAIKTPEFYEDVPLVISDDIFDSVEEEYEYIFKVWEDDGKEIRIVPKDSAHSLDLSIEKIDVHLVSYAQKMVVLNYEGRDLFTLDGDDYVYSDGKVILDDDIYEEIKTKWERRKDSMEETTGSEEVFVIFEIKLNKYDSISSERGNAKTAIMQGIQAAILEYYYQSNLATQAQSNINEIAYTIIVTLCTVIGSGGLLTDPKMLIKEPLEEVFVDPTVEAIVTDVVGDMGGNAYAQIIASSIAESGRESLTGEFSTLIKGRKSNTNTKLNPNENLKQAETQQTKARRGIIISSLLIFGMAFTGIGIPAALGLGTISITAQLGIYGKVRNSYKQALIAQSIQEHADQATGMEVGDPYEGLFPSIEAQEKYNEKRSELMEEFKKISLKYRFRLWVSQIKEQKQERALEKLMDFVKLFPERQIMADARLNAIRLGQYQLDKTSAKGIVAKYVAEVIKGESRTLGQIADEAGIDVIVAQGYIAELLFALFRSNLDIAQSYYAQITGASEFEEGATKPNWLDPSDADTYTFLSTIGPEGREISISVPKGASVGFIKYLIGKKFGLDPTDFHISGGGITLDESRLLDDYIHGNLDEMLGQKFELTNNEFLIIPASSGGGDQDANNVEANKIDIKTILNAIKNQKSFRPIQYV